MGYPVDDEALVPPEDDEETFPDLQSASVQSLIALGERRGQKVRRIGITERGNFEGAVLEGSRSASYRGFSLHADVRCEAYEREKLEHMVRYIARPPVALDRLHKRDDGLITYRLKKKYRDGTERLLFSPMELMEKLAAIVPNPRGHMTRYHGLFAPHSKNRHKIVVGKSERPSETEKEMGKNKKKTRPRMSWAKLLSRVFKRDVTECHFCKARVKVIAVVMETTAIGKILGHLNLPAKPPVISPARPPPQQTFDDFDQTQALYQSDF